MYIYIYTHIGIYEELHICSRKSSCKSSWNRHAAVCDLARCEEDRCSLKQLQQTWEMSRLAWGHYVYTPGAFHFRIETHGFGDFLFEDPLHLSWSILLLFLLLPYFRTMRAVARSYWKAKQAFGSWRRVALVFKRWKRRQKDQRTEGR